MLKNSLPKYSFLSTRYSILKYSIDTDFVIQILDTQLFVTRYSEELVADVLIIQYVLLDIKIFDRY